MADYPRRSVRPQNAPAFSLALPPGLIAVTGAEANEFITTIGGAPLIAGIVAVNGPADVAITFGSSEPIADGFKPITVDGERFRHAAFVRKASENVDGEEVRIVTMIVFDGAHAFHLTARCPQSIWSDYGPFLEDAMTSFELEAPEEKKPAPPRPIVDDGRKAVLEQVERLIGAGRFDDADRAAKAIPDSLQRDAALGRRHALEAEVQVLTHRQVREQAGFLEHHAHGAAVRRQPEAARVVLPDVLAERHASGRGPHQPRDGAQQRGLAAARRAEDGGDAARGQHRVHVEHEARAWLHARPYRQPGFSMFWASGPIMAGAGSS